MIIAVAQDSQGVEAAKPWYDEAGATYVTLVDPQHQVSSLYNLVNVPSTVWIDEAGQVRRIDEGSYAKIHRNGDFEFGRSDYGPMVLDWVANGETSEYLTPVGELSIPPVEDDALKAAPAFRLGVYFQNQGMTEQAEKYWALAQAFNPDSVNFHRQDWAYTPEEAGENWMKKYGSQTDKPYYRPIVGLDK